MTLLRNIWPEAATIDGLQDFEIVDIRDDSRQVQSGDVFFSTAMISADDKDVDYSLYIESAIQ